MFLIKNLGLVFFIALFIVFVVLFVSQIVLFVLVPQLINRMKLKASTRVKILRVLCDLPAFGDDAVKIVVITALAHYYYVHRRYEEAGGLYYRMLVCPLSVELETSFRQSLSNCLEGLGRMDEAATERHLAEQRSKLVVQTPLTCMTQAKICTDNDHHEAACALYEEALSRTPPRNRSQRQEILTKLTLSCTRAAQPERTIRWAEEAVAEGVKGVNLYVVHTQAATASLNIGNLEKAEKYAEISYRLAEVGGVGDHIAPRLAQVANIKYLNGQIEEALEIVTRAISLSPETCRTGYLYKHSMQKTLGRFDEALDTLMQYQQCTPTFSVQGGQRLDGVSSLASATLYTEIGDGMQAYTFWEQGAAAFESDPKMSLYSKAIQSWILAVLDQRSDACALIAETEDTRAIMNSPGSLRDNAWFRMRAACALEDYTLGLRLAQAYLDSNLPPVSRPSGLYFLGECRRGRGEHAAAKEAYERAVGYGFETHFSRLAAQRLQEMPN